MASFNPQQASQDNPWALLAQNSELSPVKTNKAADEAITNLLGKADKGIRDTYDAAAARAAEQEREYLKRSQPVLDAKDKAVEATNTAETFVTETVGQTKSALKDIGIEDFSLDSTKKFIREGGEKVVPAVKQGIQYVKDTFGENTPSTSAEGFGTVLAIPDVKLTEDEQKTASNEFKEQTKENVQVATVLDNTDPSTKEGMNAWQRTADLLKVPVEYLIDSWDKIDEASGGFAKGTAGLLGDAGGAVAAGANYLNDKVDFITMLAVGAQAATQTNNVGVAVLKGLAGGVQSRQQQKAAAAAQAKKDAKWAAEQNVREYNALTNRQRAEASATKGTNKPVELSTSERSVVSNYVASNKVDSSLVDQAALILKNNKAQVTPQNIKNVIKQLEDAGAAGKSGLLGFLGLGETSLLD